MKRFFFILKVMAGIALKLINSIIPKDEKLLIFGSGFGKTYSDNSRYLFEYISADKNYQSIWITKSDNIIQHVASLGFPVYKNFSIKGLYYLLRSGTYIFSTARNDVEYIFAHRNRKIINLFHGMPIKKIVYDFNKNYTGRNTYIDWVNNHFIVGFGWKHVSFSISTSPFFTEFLKTAFRSEHIVLTGLPRNDVLIQLKQNNIKSHDFTQRKFVITYMPTHRKFGRGELNPYIFFENEQFHQFLRDHNAILLYKFHPNMIHKNYVPKNADGIIRDVSAQKIDTQLLLADTDLLITDFSSCYIDYMLLDKPMVFYHYDDYEKEDTDVYFKISDQFPKLIKKSERDLFDFILKVKSEFYSDTEVKAKYHTYTDAGSCERVFQHIKLLRT